MNSAENEIAERHGDTIILLGRILMAALFLPSGFAKITGIAAFAASLEARGMPAPYVLAVIGGAAEFFGALAVLAGLKIRYAAILMIVFLVIATAISHRYWEFTDQVLYRFQRSAFFKNIGIGAGFLFLFVSGGGRWSLDAWMARKK